MASNEQFYRSQADQCGTEAEATALPLLKEKYLRSQRAWQVLADRCIETDRIRKEREEASRVAATV